MNSIYAGVVRIELFGLFAGYPLLYCVFRALATPGRPKGRIFRHFASVSPFVYAFLGLLCLALLLQNLYPDYSIEHIVSLIRQNYLLLWGVTAVLFWLPAFSGKQFLSLYHSLVFLYPLVYDLVAPLFRKPAGMGTARNDMVGYTVSLLLNISLYCLMALISYVYSRWSRTRDDHQVTK